MQFLLFAYDKYYPRGGWNDFRGNYSTLLAAVTAAANAPDVEFWHVVDAVTANIVALGSRYPGNGDGHDG